MPLRKYYGQQHIQNMFYTTIFWVLTPCSLTYFLMMEATGPPKRLKMT